MAEENVTIMTRICNWWGQLKSIQRNFILASILLVILPCLVVCVFYLCTFNEGLSKDNADWGTFGDFVGGICSLFLTAMNVWVFYKLTVAISNQEEVRAKAQKQFEMLKIKLHKQEELISMFCNAKEQTFTMVDLDNGIATINSKAIDGIMETYYELKHSGLCLATFDTEEYNGICRTLQYAQRMIHGDEDENENRPDWDDLMCSLYLKLRKIERKLKAEYRQTLNGVIISD